MRLIGLTGMPRSGKTTIADHFVKQFAFIKLSFKDALRDMLVKAQLCTQEDVDTEQCAWLMDRVGTGIFRNQIDPDYWNNRMADKILETYKTGGPGTKIIIDDVQFKEEANLIKSFGDVFTDPLIVRVGRTDTIIVEPSSWANMISADYVILAAPGDTEHLISQAIEFIHPIDS